MKAAIEKDEAYTVWLYCTNCTLLDAVRLYRGHTVEEYLGQKPACGKCGCQTLVHPGRKEIR